MALFSQECAFRRFADGPVTRPTEFFGGLTIINVTDRDLAKMCTDKIIEACGWPQEVRHIS